MTSNEIRNSFFNFFKEKSHKLVPSAPVIPHGDNTLLFTNAGMNQFKEIFLGNNIRNFKRVVDTQKCIRVSGKHNDLEEVGRDTYHHTFFEMFGNWSFGDYYKKEAILWAWELLTEVWKFPKDRLWATVYKTDEEAFEFWKSETDINRDHILRFGEKDNFWEMGETGPCGPCSEIHIDLSKSGNLKASEVNAGSPLLIEIWNLVFIQYNREVGGKLTELPAKHVDTGMGFERVCAVFESLKNNFSNLPSNYDTDLFQNIISKLEEFSGLKYDAAKQNEVNVAMRVIADHIRALSFAIADGAIPSNEGRGYVLRRILRRASRFGRVLGFKEPFLFQLSKFLAKDLGATFPELNTQLSHIEKVIKSEEEAFNFTLDRGLEIFEKVSSNLKSTIFPGEEAFKLYDTFGFPLDLTELLCKERNLTLDTSKFDEEMNKQKEKARSSSSEKFQVQISDTFLNDNIIDKSKTEFTGYDEVESRSNILFVKSEEDKSYLILEKTPLYAESGGQVSDTGWIEVENKKAKVINSKKIKSSILHFVDGSISENYLNKTATAKIDIERRNSVAQNHTATHLLHSALRSILGTHVHQSGSLVDENHLRFDFAHFASMNQTEMENVENLVNDVILQSIPLEHHRNIKFEDAKKMNALMFFGDKYGELVNVVQFGDFSKEFCGGTHILNSNKIGLFKIRGESSIASGVRRIEAVCGNSAKELLLIQQKSYKERVEHAYTLLDLLHKIKSDEQVHKLELELRKLENIPSVDDKIIFSDVRDYFSIQNNLNKKLEDLILQLNSLLKSFEKENQAIVIQKQLETIDKLIANAQNIGGIKIIATEIQVSDIEVMKAMSDSIRTKVKSAVSLLASISDNKVSLVCSVSDDLIKSKNLSAGVLVGQAAKIVNGGGGGRAHIATAGGKDIHKIKDLILEFPKIVSSKI